MKQLWLVFLILALSSCASFFGGVDNTPQPIAMPVISQKVKFKKNWETSVGGTQQKLYLDLTPSLDRVTNDTTYVYTASYRGFITKTNSTYGSKVWGARLPGHITSAVGESKNLLFVGTDNGSLYALNKRDGSIAWHKELSSTVLAQPVTQDGVVYTLSADSVVTALNARDGKYLWHYETKTPELILRGASRLVAAQDKIVIGFASGRLVCLDAKHGNEVWSHIVTYPHGNNAIERMVDIDSNLLLENNRLYVGSYNGNVAAFELATGKILWSRQMSVYKNMALGSKNLYLVDVDSKVWALSKKNGALVWNNSSFLYHNLSNPVVYKDYLVTGGSLGQLVVFSLKNGELLAYNKLNARSGVANVTTAGNSLLVLRNSGRLSNIELS